MNVGKMQAMLTYGMQVLIQLMMLAMIYVILTMSSESAKRIIETLDEVPTLHNPDFPVTEVKDGSVDFDHVSFKYSATADRDALIFTFAPA